MPGRTIFVLLGAGASFDSAGDLYVADRHWRPPLVTELFTPRFNSVLANYPMVRNAAPEILHATGAQNPSQTGLEDYLRKSFRNSEDVDDRRVFAGIPLYLQELLLQVSDKWCVAPNNYQLLDGLLRRHFAEVVYVTLNYDTLLDSVLSARRPLASFDDYVSSETRWSLIKPHGSVTWSRRIMKDPTTTGWPFHDPPSSFEQDSKLIHRSGVSLDTLRRHLDGGESVYYPAISVPLGPTATTFNCPDSHLEWLSERAGSGEPLHLLTIGYSGADRDVLDLISDAGADVATALVLAGDIPSAKEAFQRVSKVLDFGFDTNHQIGGSGFASMLSSEDFTQWISRVGEKGSMTSFFQSTRIALGVE